MRLGRFSGTVIALALLAWALLPLQAQTNPPAKVAPASKQPAKTPADQKPAAPTPGQAKTPAKAAPKANAKGAEATKARPATEAAPERAARRDPFNPLVGQHHGSGEFLEHLPPGKGGLMVSTLRVEGLVRGPNGMIAVVSNPQQRVYFLREGDQLYDGRVERITMDMVAFHEVGKDAFGRPVERQVVRRLYPSPGEMR